MQELLFAQFLSREECSLCIVAHRVQKYARIAADFFGLRSFEVLGFGRATRLVSAMPVLILRLGRRMCGSATKERFGSWFGATFWCCPILSKRAQVEFWRQREGIPALDVFKQASSANERRRRIPHQALRAQDVLESSRNSSPLPFGLCQPGSVCPLLYWFCSDCPRGQMQKEVGLVRRELCEANPCWWERNAWWSRSGGKERLVEQEWWERNAWWSRSGGEAHPCQAELLGRTIWKIEKRWKTGGAGTTRA